MGLVVKNLTAIAGDLRAMGLMPESGRGNSNSRILAWRIPWTKKSGRLWSIASERVRHDCSDLAHVHNTLLCFLYLFPTFS